MVDRCTAGVVSVIRFLSFSVSYIHVTFAINHNSAPLSGLKIIVANETIAEDQLLNVLNGNLVYLCRWDPTSTQDDADNDNIECFGIGKFLTNFNILWYVVE